MFHEIATLNARPVAHSVLPHEYSQPIPNNIFCSGNNDNTLSLGSYQLTFAFQSGQSLIEHSYRADSDLSPAGWEYSERLKEFVLERRAKSLEQRGLNPKDRRLVVHIFLSFVVHFRSFITDMDILSASCTPHRLAIFS